MAAIRNVDDWARAQLTDLGIPISHGAMQIMVGWAKAEGGNWNNSARNNPLNTTQPMPGAGNTGSQGNIKVYKNWRQGIDATTRTLKNGRYDGILAALRKGDPNAGIAAIGESPWGTGGGLVAQTIRATSGRSLPTAPLTLGGSGDAGAGAGAASGGGRVSSPGTPPTTTTSRELVAPAVDQSAARATLLQSFLSPGGGATSANRLMSVATQLKGLADIPAQYSTTTTVKPGKPGTSPVPEPANTPDGSSAGASGSFGKSHSPLLELIHNTGSGPGYAVKDGKKVNGPQFYSSVWAGHADHVHVAAGPKTIVQIGKLAQKMGLRVGENPHFGGVDPVHVPGSYHYKGEAIDVGGDKAKMNAFARKVERLYGIR